MATTPYAEVSAGADSTLRWFLMDRKLDVAEAQDKLVRMLRWRREFGCVNRRAPPSAAAEAPSRRHMQAAAQTTGLQPAGQAAARAIWPRTRFACCDPDPLLNLPSLQG
jgi:hypothetical protein